MPKTNEETFERSLKEFKENPQQRGFFIERAKGDKSHIDEEARTVWVNFSSEEPYERWFGNEILGHEKDEVDLSRMVGAALFVNHNWDDQIGVVEEVRIDDDRRGRALVRFGRSSRAEEIFQDVIDDIRRQISVGYFVNEMKLVAERDEGPDDYRVTRWQPYEVSIVSVAADPSVGVGRQHDSQNQTKPEAERELAPEISTIKEGDTMPQENTSEAPQIDVNAEREAARNAERSRVQELLKTGEKFGAMDIAQKFIADETKTVEDLHREILERRTDKPVEQAESPEIGMSENEKRSFSFLRLMNAIANPSDQGAQKAAGFELEACRAAADKRRKDTRGMFIPYDILTHKRDHSSGVRALDTSGSVGNVIDTDLLAGSFIDLLTNMLALRRCGATVLDGLNGNIAIPRQIGGATTYWVAEGADTTLTDPTFDQITMSPHSISAATELTRKTLLQTSLSMENFVRMDLARSMALGLDLAGINGSGVGEEPLGLMNQTGVGNSAVGGTNGGAPTWSHVVKMETDISSANADIGSMCYLTNALVRGKLKETEKFAGSGREIWAAGNELNGYRAEVSNQVPSDLTKGTASGICSAMAFGNFADLIVGLWGGLDIMLDPYTKSLSGGVRFIAFQDADVNVRHPESFSVFNDILTD